jgi:hypothetical protein
LDGVQVGGITATGEILVNNSNDAASGLGSQGTTGQVLTSAGSGANPTWEPNAGIPQNIQTFTADGTWVRPAGINNVWVKALGGGGQGGGADAGGDYSGGGGGGGYSEGIIAVTGNVTVQVGVGGSTGTRFTVGQTGEASTFAGTTTLTAEGGAGGGHAIGNVGSAGGAGGVPAGEDVNIIGQAGQAGSTALTKIGDGGDGAGAFGGSGDKVDTNNSTLIAKVTNGGGGGRGANGGAAGSAGADGIVVVMY